MTAKNQLGSCLLLASLLIVGCEQPATPSIPSGTNAAAPATKPDSTSAVPRMIRPAQAEPNPAEATAGGQFPQPETSASPSAAPAPVTPPQAPPTNTAGRIQLSTGIALAQTLPDGTSVLCSMGYQWVVGGAMPGVEYLWVIEIGNGQRMTGTANVSKPNGTIHAILRGVKPDQGPFKGAVFAKNQSPGLGPDQLSDFINLTN